MSRVFDKIPEWITERSSRSLNSVATNERTARIKLALHICDERQTELVVMELADDSFFIPAIFKPDDIRKKFGLSDLALSVDTLEERVVKIKAYAVSAYRSNSSLYPYLIVTDFEYIKGRSRVDNDLQHAYTVKEVETWIDHIQQSIHNLHNPVSKMFPSSALMAQYPNLATLECHLEAILPRMYRFRTRMPMNMTKEREHSNNMRNHTERGQVDHTSIGIGSSHSNHNEGMASDAMYNLANNEQLAATSSTMEWHPSGLQSTPSSRANTHPPAPLTERLTLQAYLLSTFNDIEDIPDELCVASEPEPIEETQTSPIANSPHFVDTGTSINASPGTNIATSFSPKPMSFPSSSPGPSSMNDQMILDEPKVSDRPVLIGIPHDLNSVPDDYDSFKRRRLYSDYRLGYLK
ncbi:unnamed protein product [Mucor fragilis]